MSKLRRSSDVAIYYEVSGDESSPCITLLNGYTRSSADFKMLTRRLSERRLRVITLDNRGSGQSQAGASFRLEDMADDVLALWRELGVERSHLLGVSMGGLLAQHLAVHAPAQIERLLLVSTAPAGAYRTSLGEGWPAELAGIEEKLARYFSPRFLAAHAVLCQAMAKTIWRQVTGSDFLARARAQRQALVLYGEGASLSLGQIRAPTLIVHGLDDEIFAPAAARELAAAIPDAELVLWPEAGHLLLAEKPQELFELVAAFCSEVAP